MQKLSKHALAALLAIAATTPAFADSYVPVIEEGWVVNGCSQANKDASSSTDGGFADILLDNGDRFWHTDWTDNTGDKPTSLENNPHFIVIDRGDANKNTPFYGFQFTSRNDSWTGNGYVKEYRLYVTDNVDNLTMCDLSQSGTQTAAGAHASLVSFLEGKTPVIDSEFDMNVLKTEDGCVQNVFFPGETEGTYKGVTGRYIIFVIDDTQNAVNYKHAHIKKFMILQHFDEELAEMAATAISEIENVINGASNILSATAKTAIDNIKNTMSAEGVTNLTEYTTLAEKILEIKSTIYNDINGKIITIYNHRQNKYLSAGSTNVEARAYADNASHWQIIQNGTDYNFRLLNVAAIKDIAANPGNLADRNSGRLFEINWSTPSGVAAGTALQYANDTNGVTMGQADNIDNWAGWTRNDGGASWTLALAATPLEDIATDGTTKYRIRSARAIASGQPSLFGIDALNNDTEIQSQYNLKTRADGLETIWTIHNAEDGKVYIRNVAADFEGEENTYSLASTNLTNGNAQSSLVSKNNVIAVKLEKAQEATGIQQGPLSKDYPGAIAIQTNKTADNTYYIDTQNSGNYLPIISGWTGVNNAFPNNGGVYYFEAVADQDFNALKDAFINDASANIDSHNHNVNAHIHNPALWEIGDVDTDNFIVSAPTTIAEANTVYRGVVTPDGYEEFIANADAELPSKYFTLSALHNGDQTTYHMCMGTKPAQTFLEEDAIIPLNTVWQLVSNGNGTYKLKNQATYTFVGSHNQAAKEVPASSEGGDYTLVRNENNPDNTLMLKSTTNTDATNHLLFNDKGNNRLSLWSNAEGNGEGARWAVSLVDVAVRNVDYAFNVNKEGKVVISDYVAPTNGIMALDGEEEATPIRRTAQLTEGLGDHHIITLTKDDDPETSYTFTKDDMQAEVGEGQVWFQLDNDMPQGEYTINIPMGFFTVNNKLSEPINIDIKKAANGNTTGIDEVEGEAIAPAVYYDLNGRRVLTPSHGLYIKKQGAKVSKIIL